MVIEKFEDIIAWQKARCLVSLVYKRFQDCRDFSFRDQIQRASVSIMNNIAEGFEKHGDRDFKNFLYIAKGSCGEIRSMLYLALDLKYLSEDSLNELCNTSMEISKLLSGFIKKLN